MNKLAMNNSFEIFLEKYKYFFAKNHCEIQVHTIIKSTLYWIKYGRLKFVSRGFKGRLLAVQEQTL
jgi:hypothetical protein